jgi:hypothetical protein
LTRWRPKPLPLWFFAIVVLDAVILRAASGVHSSGNDAAGNGLASAFRSAFVEGGSYLLGFLALVFVVLRHKGFRIALLVLTFPLTVFFLLLLQ